MIHSKLPWRIVDTKKKEGENWREFMHGEFEIRDDESVLLLSDTPYYPTPPDYEDAKFIVSSVNNSTKYKEALQAIIDHACGCDMIGDSSCMCDIRMQDIAEEAIKKTEIKE